MSSQERQKSKPWEAEGISRATWYRRHRETAETVRQADGAETVEAARRPVETGAVAVAQHEAINFLRGMLGKGEMAAEKVQQAARKANIAPRLLQAAFEALQVKARREKGGLCAVYWSLPAAIGSAEDAQPGATG